MEVTHAKGLMYPALQLSSFRVSEELLLWKKRGLKKLPSIGLGTREEFIMLVEEMLIRVTRTSRTTT